MTHNSNVIDKFLRYYFNILRSYFKLFESLQGLLATLSWSLSLSNRVKRSWNGSLCWERHFGIGKVMYEMYCCIVTMNAYALQITKKIIIECLPRLIFFPCGTTIFRLILSMELCSKEKKVADSLRDVLN